ncbi:MAG: glycosyltransferase family 2 protein, partial [Bacteroidota bacterium]
LGKRNIVVPQSVVYHVGGATLTTENPRKTFLNFRNSLWMLLKNLPAGQMLPVFFIRLLMDGMAGVRFLLLGKFPHLFAILKAHFYFYMKFFRFINKRESKQYSNYYKINSIAY